MRVACDWGVMAQQLYWFENHTDHTAYMHNNNVVYEINKRPLAKWLQQDLEEVMRTGEMKMHLFGMAAHQRVPQCSSATSN